MAAGEHAQHLSPAATLIIALSSHTLYWRGRLRGSSPLLRCAAAAAHYIQPLVRWALQTAQPELGMDAGENMAFHYRLARRPLLATNNKRSLHDAAHNDKKKKKKYICLRQRPRANGISFYLP